MFICASFGNKISGFPKKTQKNCKTSPPPNSMVFAMDVHSTHEHNYQVDDMHEYVQQCFYCGRDILFS